MSKIGRPNVILRDIQKHGIRIRKAIRDCKHDDVIQVRFADKDSYEKISEKLMQDFSYSLKLTIAEFKVRGELWAYIHVQHKAAA